MKSALVSSKLLTVRRIGTPLAFLCFLAAGMARAEVPHSAPQRLAGLTPAELRSLGPLLNRGPVALVEFTQGGRADLPAVHVAARIHAPAEAVVELILRPEAYPGFLNMVDKVRIVGRHGPSTVYEWGWRIALFELRGRNVMHVYRARGSAARGHRITVRAVEGDMGTGRSMFRVWPEAEGGSLLVLSMRQDLRDANYLARQLTKAARSINRSANLAMSFSLLLGLKREAERNKDRRGMAPLTSRPIRREAAVRPGPVRALRRPEIHLASLWPLLIRGDLMWVEGDGERVRQVAVLGRVHSTVSVIRRAMLDADSFGAALLPGSHAHVTERGQRHAVFDWGIRLPLVGVSGTMRIQETPELVAVDATRGAFQGGRWRFATYPVSTTASVVLGWANFDLSNSGWLMKRLVRSDPHLRHGLSVASQVMLVRALRTRLRKAREQASALP